MVNSIQFNKTGHDSFIDFLKAYCIICVILAHNLPDQNAVTFCIWGGMQVPIFLLIQVFHAFKNGKKNLDVRKIFRRIIVPFVIVEAFLFFFKIGVRIGHPEEITRFIKGFIKSGGSGPGSYYFWIYLQFAIILSLVAPLFEKWKKSTLLLLLLTLSIGGEVICSLVHMPEYVYRLLAIRYIFLIFLGYLWVKDGIVVNAFSLIMSIISLVAILFFAYTDYNLEPLFFQTGWKCHRWLCYFYVANLLVFFLYQLYRLAKRQDKFMSIISRIGQESWEIFLVQLCVFSIIPKDALQFIGNELFIDFFWIVLTLLFSIVLGHFLKIFFLHIKVLSLKN